MGLGDLDGDGDEDLLSRIVDPVERRVIADGGDGQAMYQSMKSSSKAAKYTHPMLVAGDPRESLMRFNVLRIYLECFKVMVN